MEFHIARTIREKLNLDEVLFSYTGNVIFANVAASRKMAQQMNALAEPNSVAPATPVNASALFAMGLIDELSHAMVERYRKEVDPNVLTEGLSWLESKTSKGSVDKLLLTFTTDFPNVSIFRGDITPAVWLAGSTEGLPNREAAFEELMMLWLANKNAAFKPFQELFGDAGLKEKTIYSKVDDELPQYLATRPEIAPEVGTLLDALVAPMLAAPDSLTGQLQYIRERWADVLGPTMADQLKRVLLAIDVVREEEIAVWMRFHPGPGANRPGPGELGYQPQGFVGDEYVGFEGEYITGPDGVRRLKRFDPDYQAPLNEYEAFSQDQAWMPNVVMMAKSTFVWLEQLSKKYGKHIHRLDHIPDEELQLLADRGMTALWLIGLWERSTASRTIKNLRGQADAVASAYSLKDYRIADDLGGNQAYEALRDKAARFGLRLASDMVPNHMGIDSTWVIEHPDWFVERPDSPFPSYSFNGPDLSTDPAVEIKIDDHYYDMTDAAVAFRLRTHSDDQTHFLYHGNDGTTFAWNDTAQLDYSKSFVREQVMQTILHVARLFPIIRFDAAMVLAKRHVQRLWFPLPGVGGSIPSRAENSMSQEEFDALMPTEFWREVVDRVVAEVPGTLLLAEAFWMLEGYFVRTLGMHRVYNSAFMNMIKDEENAKYRSYLKKTIEFDPDILGRYVNFMSNPDEKTAREQFGDGDKFFGTAMLMATLPGLPMFAHGQVEGFNERYGMDFKTAKQDEHPDSSLMARHQHEIAPLLKNRSLFAGSQNFVLYDFWAEHGGVDENVFAYSNRVDGQRALLLYNNAYASTRGTIHTSAASMDKGSGQLIQRTLKEGLGITGDPAVVLRYRDPIRQLDFLVRAHDVEQRGMRFDLRGYGYTVLQGWTELRSTAEQPWDRLCDALGGQGVSNLDEALAQLRTRPLLEALRAAINETSVALFAQLAEESSDVEIGNRLDGFLTAANHVPQEFTALGVELDPPDLSQEEEEEDTAEPTFAESCEALTLASVRLPAEVVGLHGWPAVMAWVILRSLPTSDRADAFDRLGLRAVLAEVFRGTGLLGEDSWRAAARVRLLLQEEDAFALWALDFWAEPDVRWLAGVNESAGITYLNQESFEQLAGWMQVPALVEAVLLEDEDLVAGVEEEMAEALLTAEEAGYRLDDFLALGEPEYPNDLEDFEDADDLGEDPEVLTASKPLQNPDLPIIRKTPRVLQYPRSSAT